MRVCILPQVVCMISYIGMHVCMCTPTNISNQLRRPILTYAERFVRICLHLADIWGFVYCPKFPACFRPLCMHKCTCTPINNIYQSGRPILTYAESFMKIWLHLAKIWGFVYCPKLRACFHELYMHQCTCTPMNIINQLRRSILKYVESFVNIWLNLAEL